MSSFKKYQPFIKAIKDYGLYTEISKKHLKIMKDGNWVALDHTLRHLIADGHLPKINRRNYEHELKKAAK